MYADYAFSLYSFSLTIMSAKWSAHDTGRPRIANSRIFLFVLPLLPALALTLLGWNVVFGANAPTRIQHVPSNAQQILSKCMALRRVSGPSDEFFEREASDRYVPGTNATLILNATIFTGQENGTYIIHGDLLLDKGIVKAIGDISKDVLDNTPNLTIVHAENKWVTPGLGIA